MTTLLMATAVLSGLGHTDKAKTYDFRLRPTPGQITTYAISTEMTPIGAEGKAGFAATVRSKFLGKKGQELKWHHTTTVRSAQGTGVFQGFADNIKAVDGFNFIAVTNDLGAVLRYEKNEALSANSETPNLVFPGRPIPVGGRWKIDISVGGKKIGVTYTLKAIENRNGRELGRVEGQYDPGQGVTALEPTTIWFDTRTGETEAGKGSVTYGENGRGVKLSFTVKRI
ncbi:MAG: hypothetical protein KIT11_10910 [Fimbriimonadaceae bacterium]|nr:hypothetical protein [Fimbriimonadaceae bacterium]QYK55831.1 MAG: hypothetical protein KF733_12580 [Fimbriimonadaceae bacterium]